MSDSRRFRSYVIGVRQLVWVAALGLAACGGGGGDDSGSNTNTNSNNNSNSSSDDVSDVGDVTIPENLAPVARASVSQAGAYSAQTVMLDGQASSDADGSIAEFSWEQTMGPGIVIDAPAAASASFVVPPLDAPATIGIRLRVRDDDGDTSETTVSVAVVPAPVVSEVVLADGAAFRVDDESIELVVNSASLNGTPVTPVSLTWSSSINGQLATSSELGQAVPVNLDAGVHTLTLHADWGSLGSTSEEFQLRVLPRMLEVPASQSEPAPGHTALMPVVAVTHVPTLDGVNLDLDVASYFYRPPEWSSNLVADVLDYVQLLGTRTKFALEERSRFRGYSEPGASPWLGYQVVAHYVIYEPMPQVDDADPADGIAPVADLRAVMSGIDAETWVEQHDVREFWLWTYFSEEFQLWTSNMSSPTTGDVSNSNRDNDDLPEYSKTYYVYGYNYHRTQAEAIHNHGLQMQAMFDHVDRLRSGNSELFWGSYVGVPGFPGPPQMPGRCGSISQPPNTTAVFGYLDQTFVNSDCEDWRPDGAGARRLVNSAYFDSLSIAWPGTSNIPQRAESQYYLWWMQNMPGDGNTIPYGSNTMENWWRFIADWDAAIDGGLALHTGWTQPVPPGLSFTTDMSVVPAGQPVTLSWATTDVDTCVAEQGWSGQKGPAGSELTQPLTATTSFLLSCTGPGGTIIEQVTVVVEVSTDPVATSDLVSAIRDIPRDIDVLANDQQFDMPVTITITTPPTQGTAAVVDGWQVDSWTWPLLRYAPGADYEGDDFLEYQLTDADGDTASAAVSISVGPTLRISPFARFARLGVIDPEAWTCQSVDTVARRWSNLVYESFEDSFDFIFFLSNAPAHCAGAPYGQHVSARNDVSGIGLPIYDNTAAFGSSGRLRGVIWLNSVDGLLSGPALHEIAHSWANFIADTEPVGVGAHWGVSSGGGQLGGFALSTLEDLGADTYRASTGIPGLPGFGVVANFGNSVPYSELERYLMGLGEAASVPDLVIAREPAYVSEGVFTATELERLTIDDIIDQHGVRVPSFQDSQKDFRALVVVITATELADSTYTYLDGAVENFGLTGDDGSATLYNFWEATGGHGTLDMEGIDQELR